ncbi:CDP-alcohol phosphatidyltransferase family protein [Paractinoplanes brasiliensis]|uniref:CDP-diacylglycerol--glycerol-3-phosphate 3-phosphatidyltransferase n=1 Tax=Paractinoplanes brasiliensis TaxID=52695 RepID=A0A4R6JNH0_9ACTN|nr:CDP-alcohol phosphatidyltransferase family protein [Actinoplanes brasiliensis]TDO37749.1 CDP-diacylglycerol--glycerol-3-phosphate 3-phosphatidyltransferase [Actinoplanes brasiliensis]GID32089.1 CDP-diacylglycerol--glycerol-3-phosphate 3-phosphatidyltransferase [Actinoplanes brasiliensis]
MLWDDYATAWSGLHGGFDPRRASFLVRGWVRIAYGIGSWLARRGISPMAVTTAGLLVCLTVPAAVLLGRWGGLLAAVLVLVAALADGLDGAVAVITGRTTRLGYVYDSVADRLGELAWLTAFWLAGAPDWLVVAAGAVSWLQEYGRARAAAAGMSEIGVVTVAERPTRVLVAIFGLLPTALMTASTTVAAAVWLALSLVGGVQLAIAVQRALGRSDPG